MGRTGPTQDPDRFFDPGDDFALSFNDVGLLLHLFAERLVAGDLPLGIPVTMEFDDGAALGHFTPGNPVEPETVGAFQTPPGATVIPLRWELVRPAPGAPQPPDPARVAEVEAYAVAILQAAMPVADGIELYLLQLEDMVAEEDRLLRSFARSAGFSDGYRACSKLAGECMEVMSQAIEAVVFGSFVHDDHLEALNAVTGTALTCAFTAKLLQDHIDREYLGRMWAFFDGLLDVPGADALFWSQEGTDAIRQRAAALSSAELKRLAEPLDRERHHEFRMEFLDSYWHASAIVLAEGGGNPLPAETLPSHPDLSPDLQEWATDAVAAAAMAVALRVCDGWPPLEACLSIC